MTDDELRDLLAQIRELALRPFPFRPRAEVQNDRVLVFALGRIAGIAAAALDQTAR